MKFALIAHDGKKADMVSFVIKRLDFFNQRNIDVIATGTTGKMLIDAGVTKVQRVASGPMGGDAEIGAMITRGEISALIFFRDPLDKHPHDVDISMLLRLCDVHNIPLATNKNSGNMLVYYFKHSQQ